MSSTSRKKAPAPPPLNADQAARRIQSFFRTTVRNKVYRTLRQEFHSALGMSSVGRALLHDPHIANARLIRDPRQPPVHTQNQQNPFEDTINMLGPTPFEGHGRSPDVVRKEHSATYTHEAIHKWNHQTQPTVFEQRKLTSGTHPAWDSAEEEFVISGYNPANPTFQYNSTLPPGHSAFNENAARKEMGLPPRHSHRAVHDDLPGPMNKEQYANYQATLRRQEDLIVDHSTASTSSQQTMQQRFRARMEARQAAMEEKKRKNKSQ